MTQPAPRNPASTQPPPVTSRLAAVPDDPPRLYTFVEAAKLLQVPEGWLRKKVTAGAVPHTRLGKHVRFTDDHLRRIVEAGEQVPTALPAAVAHGLSPRSRRPRPTP
jgi:excisionase family DNA binding protein